MHSSTEFWNIDVTGTDVDRWFSQLGRRTVGPPHRRAGGDYVATEKAYLSRIWVSAVTESLYTPAVEGEFCRLIIVLNGALTFHQGFDVTVLTEGEVFAIHPGTPHVLRCAQQCARVEIGIADSTYTRPADSPGARSLDASVAKPLTALANGILSSKLGPSSPGWSYLESSLITLVHGALASGHADPKDPYLRALDHLREHAGDPDFTVGGLARALHLSERTIQRAFGTHSTTPSVELSRARANRAARLTKDNADKRRSAEEIAALSGFRSVRTMRSAQRRFESSNEL